MLSVRRVAARRVTARSEATVSGGRILEGEEDANGMVITPSPLAVGSLDWNAIVDCPIFWAQWFETRGVSQLCVLDLFVVACWRDTWIVRGLWLEGLIFRARRCSSWELGFSTDYAMALRDCFCLGFAPQFPLLDITVDSLSGHISCGGHAFGALSLLFPADSGAFALEGRLVKVLLLLFSLMLKVDMLLIASLCLESVLLVNGVFALIWALSYSASMEVKPIPIEVGFFLTTVLRGWHLRLPLSSFLSLIEVGESPIEEGINLWKEDDGFS
ncbi:hypothetical protein SUGI_0199670 [Cryptomeria japonica]|nr:hypothetical protein SUGI_0199670 [Cryptomeria japonica]